MCLLVSPSPSNHPLFPTTPAKTSPAPVPRIKTSKTMQNVVSRGLEPRFQHSECWVITIYTTKPWTRCTAGRQVWTCFNLLDTSNSVDGRVFSTVLKAHPNCSRLRRHRHHATQCLQKIGWRTLCLACATDVKMLGRRWVEGLHSLGWNPAGAWSRRGVVTGGQPHAQATHTESARGRQ